MHIESLKYFLAVVDIGSFSKAALENDISQSSLSKHVMQLEKDLKVTLFDRNTHKLELTDAGRVFAAYAENILKQYNLMVSSVEQYSSDMKINLRIMCMPILNLYSIADMIVSFRKANPTVKLQLLEAEMPTIRSEISRHAVDAVIVRETIFSHDGDLALHRIIDDELVLVCANSHALGKRERIDFSELADVHFLLTMPSVADFLGSLLERGGVNIDLDRSSSLAQKGKTLSEQLHDGGSALLVSSELAKHYTTDPKLVAIQFKDPLPFSVAIGVNKNNRSPVVQDFLMYGLGYFKRQASDME